MAKTTNRRKLLEDLRRQKRNRSVKEAAAVLEAYGWTSREPSKEGSFWRKGELTLTLPDPHGSGDKSLHPRWVSLVVRMIEQGETEEQGDQE